MSVLRSDSTVLSIDASRVERDYFDATIIVGYDCKYTIKVPVALLMWFYELRAQIADLEEQVRRGHGEPETSTRAGVLKSN